MINSIIFAVLIAVSAIFVEDATGRYPLWFSIFFHTLMTIIIFNALAWGKNKNTYMACRNNISTVFLMMVFSMLIYVFCFFSTDLIGGSPYNTFYFSVSGFLGYLFVGGWAKGLSYKKTVLALGLLIVLFAVYRATYVGVANEELRGFAYAVLASFSGFAYAVYSQRLAEKEKLSSVQILSVRFYLLLAVSSFLLPANTAELVTPKSMLYMLMLSVTGMLLPVYFLQRGILAVGAEVNAIVVAFVPFLTLILAAAFHGSYNIRESLFVIVITACLLTPPVMVAYKKIGGARSE